MRCPGPFVLKNAALSSFSGCSLITKNGDDGGSPCDETCLAPDLSVGIYQYTQQGHTRLDLQSRSTKTLLRASDAFRHPSKRSLGSDLAM
jgi:hypothetical protein